MFNQIDCILFTIISFMLCYILTALLHIQIWLCLIFSLMISLLIGILLLYLNSKKQKHIDYNSFVENLVVDGEEKLILLLQNNFEDTFTKEEKLIIYKEKPAFFWLNFANISLDSMLKYYRICKENNYSSAIVFIKNKDKKYYQFLRFFDNFIFEFESYKLLYNKLKTQEKLPQKSKLHKRKFLETISIILKSAFCRRNCKHFLFTAFFILLMSFITPLKTYYLVMAGVATILAAICLFRK